MKRVLFLAWAPFFSGAERALLLTVQQLDPRQFVPHVVVGTSGDTLEAFRAAGVPCELAPLDPVDSRHPVRSARTIARLLKVVGRTRPALIHANEAPSFQPGGYVARLARLPAITHVRFPAGDAGFRWFLRAGFARALFVSEYLRSEAVRDSPELFGSRADVLHDGVALPALIPESTRAALRVELGLPPSVPVVGLTGQIAEVKGIWEFVEAARLLVERQTEVRFAVLGDDLKGRGALRQAMERRVAELRLATRFHFLGFRPDAPRLIPAFDIVAVPSHVEPLGNATLEAMATGRPVVGSRTGGIPEMVVDGETGLLVPPRDAPALAGALAELLGSPARRLAFGAAGRARASAEFSLERHGKRLQAIYAEVLAADPRAPRLPGAVG